MGRRGIDGRTGVLLGEEEEEEEEEVEQEGEDASSFMAS